MRTLILLLLFSSLTLGASLTTTHQDGETPLQTAMSELNSSLRAFRKATKGEQPDKALALAELMKMQRATHAAKLEVPESAPQQGAEARAFTRDYRKALIACQRALLDLEVLVIDEKYDEINQSIRTLLEQKKKIVG